MLFSSANVVRAPSVRTLAPEIDIVYRFVRLACPAIRRRLRFLTDRRRRRARQLGLSNLEETGLSSMTIVAEFPTGKGTSRSVYWGMTERSKFRSEMTKSGRWFVSVITGHGPDSHVGDFAPEEEAQHWISTKSNDWPHPVNQSDPLPPFRRR
jgi:hypothetical protein